MTIASTLSFHFELSAMSCSITQTPRTKSGTSHCRVGLMTTTISIPCTSFSRLTLKKGADGVAPPRIKTVYNANVLSVSASLHVERNLRSCLLSPCFSRQRSIPIAQIFRFCFGGPEIEVARRHYSQRIRKVKKNSAVQCSQRYWAKSHNPGSVQS